MFSHISCHDLSLNRVCILKQSLHQSKTLMRREDGKSNTSYFVTSLTVISKPTGPGLGLNNLTLAFGAKYSLISFSNVGSGRVKRLSVRIYSMVPSESSLFFHPGAPKRNSFPYFST